MIFFFFQISTFPEEEFRAAAGAVLQVRKEQDAKDVRNREDRLPDNAKIRLLCNGVTGLLVPPEFRKITSGKFPVNPVSRQKAAGNAPEIESEFTSLTGTSSSGFAMVRWKRKKLKKRIRIKEGFIRSCLKHAAGSNCHSCPMDWVCRELHAICFSVERFFSAFFHKKFQRKVDSCPSARYTLQKRSEHNKTGRYHESFLSGLHTGSGVPGLL